MMRHKKNQPTAQELYKARRQREEEEKVAHLPPGLINHGNTCFMNSTLQGLLATELLHHLVFFEPISASLQNSLSHPLLAKRSPQLTNGHGLGGEYERERVDGMPLGDVFIDVMRKAWDIQERRSRETMSPKELLFMVGKKYDQYMGFRQQDAHEFLRHTLDAMRMEELDIIKQRQPPPPKTRRKSTHRKRSGNTTSPSVAPSTSAPVNATTITSVSLPSPSSAPSLTSALDSASLPESEQLHSFVDMLFGGQLASILVCEKCKKVSVTHEEFNDLSLSIRPEDYVHKGRRRDRFKMFAQRITGPFRGEGGGRRSGLGHRSSSVPAGPARHSSEAAAQDEEPPTNEGPRRRSFEHVEEAVEAEEAKDVLMEMSSPRPDAAEGGDTSAEATEVESNDKDRGDADINKEKREKDREDAWGRFGRRLSVSVKKGMKVLDPGSPNRSIERGRRTSSKDFPRISQGDDTEREVSRPSTPTIGTVTAILTHDNGSDIGDHASDVARVRVGTPIPSPLGNPPITAASSSTPAAIASSASSTGSGAQPAVRHPAGRRTRKPRAPKPSREEAAYLRQLLADVHTASANPFVVLTQALSSSAHGVPAATSAQASWAKLGHLPGIEECLRLFTAVEILDGENMVGCHRCWKIANGMYKPRKGADVNEDDEDEAGSEGDADADADAGEGSEDSLGKPPESSEPVESGQNIPTAPSADALSLSSDTSMSSRASPSSASAFQSMTSLSDALSDTTSGTSSPDPSATSVPSVAGATEKAADTVLLGQSPPATYGGLPIPLISTTGPESPISPPTSQSSPSDATDSARISTQRPDQYSKSPSDESLLTPRGRRFSKSRADQSSAQSDSSDDNYESDSDMSGSMSAYSDASPIASPSMSPVTSPRTSVDDLTLKPHKDRLKAPANAGASSSKVSRSKQVILRRMYKRYLIADPPPILVVHLKRFQQTTKNHAVSFSGIKKLDDFVAFPEYLDLKPFLAPRREDFGWEKDKDKVAKDKGKESGKDRQSCMYRLYAVVVHFGNMLGGHYIAYTALPGSSSANVSNPVSTPDTPAAPAASNTAANQQCNPIGSATQTGPKTQRQWAYISDTVVRLTTIDEVLKAKAYICMYERI